MKLVGERRAIAAAVFAFFSILWWSAAAQVPMLAPAMYGLLGVYGLAFFGLVAGYFWARWYAMGVGLFGVIVAIVMTWQMGELIPEMIFFGGSHIAATLFLWGDAMSEPFEGQRGWRDRFHMDDNAVQRLGRSVIRAGVSLPFVLLYGLMPKPEGGNLASLLAVGLALVGFGGLVKMRTWGMLAMAAGGAVMFTIGLDHHALTIQTGLFPLNVSPLATGLVMMLVAAPFAPSMRRWIAAR